MFIWSYLSSTFWGSGEKNQDLILKVTGSFGLYQKWLVFLIFFTRFPIAFNQMAIIFLGPPATYACMDTKTINGCPCTHPVYDRRIFSNTIVMEWNLICEKKWLVSFSQLAFQAGTFFGSLFFGMASDKYGRRGPLILACGLQFVCAMSSAYAPTFELFTIFRIGTGLSVGGTMVIGFVILMEYVGPKDRELLSVLYHAPFNMGCITMPLIAYYNRSFRDFQMVCSLATLPCIIYLCYLPETPRWLLAHNKTERAIKILEKVAKINKLPVNTVRADVQAYQLTASKKVLVLGTTADLFRTPNLRKRTLAMAFNWLTCSYCFYGVSQYIGQLTGDIFLNVITGSSITLGGTILSGPLMKVAGRRTILLVCHLLCAFCLFILAFTDGWINILCATIGSVSSFIVFVVVYLHCGEIFPTVVRNCAVGLSSMVARIGSMVAPFVLDLKDIHRSLTPIAFGVIPFMAFFITLVLPETKGCELTTTLEEGEKAFTKQGENAIKQQPK